MLRYVIKPYERAFTFQILSQDSVVEDAINSVGGSFLTSNGWTIRVNRSPEVKVISKRIFLRGSNSSLDLRVDRTWNFGSNRERDMYMRELEYALEEIISFSDEYDSSRYYSKKMDFGSKWTRNYLEDDYVPKRTRKARPYVIHFAPEVDVYTWLTPRTNSVVIDANGWGNNKPQNYRW